MPPFTNDFDKSKKIREWCIVIHNVKTPGEIQSIVDKYSAKGKEFVSSIEPYPHQPGHHLHLFIEYPSQRFFKPLLKELNQLSNIIAEPKPEGETRSWGRVELTRKRGTWNECRDYLEGLTKDKPIGEVTSNRRELVSVPSDCTKLHRALGLSHLSVYCPTCPYCAEKQKLQEELHLLVGIKISA